MGGEDGYGDWLMGMRIYGLFFLSGLAGLIYEIIWGRWLVLIFGSTTNSLTATISAFLGGLAIGSFAAGGIVDRLKPKTLLRGYSWLEAGVGVTALFSPWLFSVIRQIYFGLSDGSSVTTELLVIKFALTALVILVPTTLMGATLPFLVRFLQMQIKLPDVTLSRLYAVNTLGGMAGVLAAGFVLFELAGLGGALAAAAGLNILVAVLAGRIKISEAENERAVPAVRLKISPELVLGVAGFGVSGFVAIGYQILWTRVLTPGMGTMVYAFSSILAFYLLGLGLGAWVYPVCRRWVGRGVGGFGLLQLGIGAAALIPVLIMHKTVMPANLELVMRLLPATLLFGLTFPAVMSVIDQPGATGRVIGWAYLGNTAGAILGGFAASFVLIPRVGSSAGIVGLAVVNFVLAWLFAAWEKKRWGKLPVLAAAGALFLVGIYLVTYKRARLLPFKTDWPILEAGVQGVAHRFLEDEAATVFAKGKREKEEPQLVIDGVATTHRVGLTKYMAHLPILMHPRPGRVLVVALGMGNTYRSSLKHGIETDAVELVPSVPKMADLFHQENITSYEKGRIIINDGRNYAFLTRKKYDIVITDPPPPFNTAGSTVLHSVEYYRDLRRILNKGGIVNQWIYAYGARADDISMAIRTFLEVFPQVLAVQKADSPGGIFLMGSDRPLERNKVYGILKNKIVFEDLLEVADREYVSTELEPMEIIGDRESLMNQLGEFPLITDTHPRTEYFLIRHRTTFAPTLVEDELIKFIAELKNGET